MHTYVHHVIRNGCCILHCASKLVIIIIFKIIIVVKNKDLLLHSIPVMLKAVKKMKGDK